MPYISFWAKPDATLLNFSVLFQPVVLCGNNLKLAAKILYFNAKNTNKLRAKRNNNIG